MQQNLQIEHIYSALKDASKEIATYLRYHSAHLVESFSPFGKQQSTIDLEADRMIHKHLLKSGVVYSLISEESAQMQVINPEGVFIVSYDPIDGNNVLDANMSVASIFGVWHAKDINGLSGRDLVGAVCTVYGSRTSLVWYNP